jgi:plastocyanin
LKVGSALAIVSLAIGAASLVYGQGTDLSARVKVIHDGGSTESGHPENVVVWLSPLDSRPDVESFHAGPLRLTQHNKSFEPHILVVPVGALVEFPNRDPFFHNVFSLFDGKRFDLGLYEAGSTRKVSFDRPGISYIFCNIHAEMSAVVVALDTPYFGLSDRKGELVISHVPAGRYTMHVWYETALPATLKAMTREVDVTPETSTLGVLQIPAETTVHAHKNKYGMDYEPPPSNGSGYDRPTPSR